MNKYVGKTCPFCKTGFTEDDDIVLCSACDMPHHKSCWVENQGCTTFGCTGTIRSVGGTVTSVTSSEFVFDDGNAGGVFCVRCGSKNVGGNLFCVSCGTKLPELQRPAPVQPPQQPAYQQPAQPAYQQPAYQQPAQPTYQQPAYQQPAQPAYQQPAYQQPAQPTYQQPAYQQPAQPTYQQPAYQQPAQPTYQQPSYQQPNSYHPGGFTARQPNVDPDVLALVGSSGAPYYTTAFEKLKNSGGKTSWNWGAFFLTPYWFIYRKMYLYGGCILGGSLILNLLGLGILSIAVNIAAGILGNWLYMTHLEKLAGQGKWMQEPQKSEFLRNSGDTNLLAAILSVGGYVALVLLL